MKIGLFTDTYKPQVNGVATSIETLVDELKEMGHDVYIVSQNESMTKYEISDDMVRVPGLKLHLLDDKRLTHVYPVRIINRIRSWDLDVIHSHTEFGIGTFARIFAKQYKIPLVHTYHTMYEDYSHYISRNNVLFDRPVKHIIKALSKFYCNTTTELIVPTTKTKNALMKYGLTKEPHVIPTGIKIKIFYNENFDKEYINKIKKENNINEDNFVVLYIGRVSKEKSIDVIIESFKSIYEKHNKARLLIIGDGPDMSNLKKLVKKLDLENAVVFAGRKPWSDISTYYQCGDVFVTASKTETQGLTIIEALSASLPVLCYNDDSFKEMITNGVNGYFFNDSKELSEQLFTMIEDKEKHDLMAERARRSVVEFSSEKFAEDVLKVYNIAIENGKINNGNIKKILSRR